MKFFIAFFLVAACVAQCLSATVQGVNENLEPLRIRKSAKSAYGAPAPSYGGSSYSAPPCPTNYLFSCGPQLQPVPCAQGYQGSYSENIPQYAAPQYVAPPQYAFPQYAVPVITEV